ncbi:MAG: MBL fold metallo-hydrolase, partial [Candidatus Dadabacteria bacterium]
MEYDKKKILVDCGLFQGKKELRLRNWSEPPFDISKLSAIVLTHAHLDHTGYLPLIVKRGYRGPIYCTAATRELLKLLLPDSAYLQEEEARFANKHGTSKHKPALPLYDRKDAEETLKLLKIFDRHREFKVADNCILSSVCAGHILGSVSLALEIHGRRIVFSGDIGRYNTPILPAPTGLPCGDLMLCESTYGNREHQDSNLRKILGRIVRKTYERRSVLLIPAFAIGRTQTLLYHLADMERDGDIPVLPVYVDSPMAVDATGIYRRFKHDFDEEAQELIRAGETPLLTENTIFCRSVNDSKRLNSLRGSRIIISASGMVTGGRILHHMRQWLPKEETTVLFVGYQAYGTRGQIIQSGAREVKIFGQPVPIRAQVETISGLSAHGDRNE